MKRKITAMILTTFAISTVIPATAFASSYEDMSDLQTKYEQHLEKYNLSSEELPPPSEEDLQRDAEFDEMMDKLYAAYEAYYANQITLNELAQLESQYYEEYDPGNEMLQDSSLANDPERQSSLEAKKATALQTRSSVEITPFAIYDNAAYLAMPYEYQINDYYCGPATAVNIINGKGITNVSQSWAASLLGTTASSGTPFDTNWRNVLHEGTMGKSYTVKAAWTESNWPMELAERTISSLRQGCGVVADTYMYSAATYLPGYSSGEIKHYVPIYGYEAYDPTQRRVLYIDVNQFNGAAVGHHNVTFQEMALATAGFGIVY